MTQLNFKANDYDFYPRTMIRLSEIAYDDIDDIKTNVKNLYQKKENRFDVVWGPAEATSIVDIAYSLMFVAYRAETNEYVVVIRGTNPLSLEAWCEQDFAIGNLQPFDQLAPEAPSDALVSQGTFNGMSDLIGLRDPVTDVDVVSFLRGLKNNNLYVCGHSLGGTLTPPLFAYLNDVLYGGGHVTNMALWSFAGLTVGDAGFNAYFNGLGNPEFRFRLHNTLDIAPFCWSSLENIRNIYEPYDLKWGLVEEEYLKHKFNQAAGLDYAQPLGDKALPGKFDTKFIDDHLWTSQAMHQHHSTTYKKLVDIAYPKNPEPDCSAELTPSQG